MKTNSDILQADMKMKNETGFLAFENLTKNKNTVETNCSPNLPNEFWYISNIIEFQFDMKKDENENRKM